MIKLLINIFFFSFLMALSLPVQAQQENLDLSKIQEIPTFLDELSLDEFREKTDLYQEKPLNDPYLAYNIRLPVGWQKAETISSQTYKNEEMKDAGVSQRILGEVAKYYGPSRIEGISKLEINALSLEFEITAKNWFMQEVLLRGYSLEGLKIISEKRVEALYVIIEGDITYVVRAAAEINGPRMIVTSYYIPDIFWESEKAMQERVINSFEFQTPEKSKIELTRSYAFLDLLSFDYPASWRLIAPNIYSIEGMEAKLVHSIDSNSLGGEIHISVISTDFEGALIDEINYLKEDLVNRGLEIGALIETKDDYDKPEHVYYNHVERYKAIDTNSKVLEHEFWIAVLEEDRYFYVITMITPGRNSEFYTWARNGEAFETVVESFSP